MGTLTLPLLLLITYRSVLGFVCTDERALHHRAAANDYFHSISSQLIVFD